MMEIPCGLSSAYFIDSKTNEFTNNYTIDNAIQSRRKKYQTLSKIPMLQNFSGYNHYQQENLYVYTENGKYHEQKCILTKILEFHYNGKI